MIYVESPDQQRTKVEQNIIQEVKYEEEQDSVEYDGTQRELPPKPYDQPIIPFSEQANETQIFDKEL